MNHIFQEHILGLAEIKVEKIIEIFNHHGADIQKVPNEKTNQDQGLEERHPAQSARRQERPADRGRKTSRSSKIKKPGTQKESRVRAKR